MAVREESEPRKHPTGVLAADTMYTAGRPEGFGWTPLVAMIVACVAATRQREGRKKEGQFGQFGSGLATITCTVAVALSSGLNKYFSKKFTLTQVQTLAYPP